MPTDRCSDEPARHGGGCCYFHERMIDLRSHDSHRAPEGRGAVAPDDGAHHASNTDPGDDDAPGNAGGGTTAPGPAAESPVSTFSRTDKRCPRCTSSMPKDRILCRSCWSLVPAELLADFRAAAGLFRTRAAVRAILTWAKEHPAELRDDAPGGVE